MLKCENMNSQTKHMDRVTHRIWATDHVAVPLEHFPSGHPRFLDLGEAHMLCTIKTYVNLARLVKHMDKDLHLNLDY